MSRKADEFETVRDYAQDATGRPDFMNARLHGFDVLNLNSLNDTIERPYNAIGNNRLAFQIGAQFGTSMSTGRVVIEGTIDGTTWSTIVTLSGSSTNTAINIAGYTAVRPRVSVVEGSTSTVRCCAYGYITPFEES